MQPKIVATEVLSAKLHASEYEGMSPAQSARLYLFMPLSGLNLPKSFAMLYITGRLSVIAILCKADCTIPDMPIGRLNAVEICGSCVAWLLLDVFPFAFRHSLNFPTAAFHSASRAWFCTTFRWGVYSVLVSAFFLRHHEPSFFGMASAQMDTLGPLKKKPCD